MKKFKLAAVLSGVAAASMLVSFAGAGTAMAAPIDHSSDVVDVAVGKLFTVAPGTTIADTTFDTVFTLQGLVQNQGNDGVNKTPAETLDPLGPAAGSQVVHVPVTVPAQTAGVAACDPRPIDNPRARE